MADTTPLAPTDPEIAALRSEFGITSNGRGIKEFTQVRDFARAVLARWGQPAHSGEPVAWAKMDGGQARGVSNADKSADPEWVPLYPAPQPVEREPLSDEKVDSLCKVGPVYAPDGKVTRTPAQYRDELEAAQRYGLRKGERAHGIKKVGQHGAEY